MSTEDHNDNSDDSTLELVEAPSATSDDDTRVSVYFDSKEADETANISTEKRMDDEEYRMRVYGTNQYMGEPRRPQLGSVRRISQRLSKELTRRRSSVTESLPETPAGWTVLASAVMTTVLGYELHLQKSLTRPPVAFGQLPNGTVMNDVYKKMTAQPGSILSRSIQPSLFVGTRGTISSTAAYLLGGPSATDEHMRFRDIINNPIDGGRIGIDWEVPWKTVDPRTSGLSAEERRNEILEGPIREPVIVILHGINNHSNFGYMRSLQRSFANRGWNAAAMNFRGCGGVPLRTPRAYNGAYTGDLRCLLWTLSSRLAEDTPIFLVGNSLGASIMTKYLGEEGSSGTLPKCVSGAASLGNPLTINSALVRFPFDIAMAMGVKKTILENWSAFRQMKDSFFQNTYRKTLFSATIANLDRAVAPVLIRNEPFYPFAFRIGFKDGDEYWRDASSYKTLHQISVPYLNLTAEDDFLVAQPNKNKLGFCISNPNVMVAETRCGGHLGWQESPPESESSFGATSWSDAAAADFFDAVMKTNIERTGARVSKHTSPGGMVYVDPESQLLARERLRGEAERFSINLKSRL